MTEFKLGDRVRFTGIVVKDHQYWESVRYRDAPPPEFIGYNWSEKRTDETRNAVTHYPITEGVVVGKRRYRSMGMEDGIWIPDMIQDFTGYLVAYHLSRNPVIVRVDQIEGAKQ